MNEQTTESIHTAMDMAENLQEISSERLCWLIMKSELANLAEFSPGAILVGEAIRRLAGHLEGATITHDGWVLENGQLVSYED